MYKSNQPSDQEFIKNVDDQKDQSEKVWGKEEQGFGKTQPLSSHNTQNNTEKSSTDPVDWNETINHDNYNASMGGQGTPVNTVADLTSDSVDSLNERGALNDTITSSYTNDRDYTRDMFAQASATPATESGKGWKRNTGDQSDLLSANTEHPNTEHPTSTLVQNVRERASETGQTISNSLENVGKRVSDSLEHAGHKLDEVGQKAYAKSVDIGHNLYEKAQEGSAAMGEAAGSLGASFGSTMIGGGLGAIASGLGGGITRIGEAIAPNIHNTGNVPTADPSNLPTTTTNTHTASTQHPSTQHPTTQNNTQ